MATNPHRIHTFMRLYDNGHQTRKAYFHKRLRLFIAICAVIFLMLVYAYINAKYDFLASPLDGSAAFILSDKLFYWFLAGLIAGAFIAHFTNEAEHLYSVWKLAGKITTQFGKNVETEVERDFGMKRQMAPKGAKTAKYGRKGRKKR